VPVRLQAVEARSATGSLEEWRPSWTTEPVARPTRASREFSYRNDGTKPVVPQGPYVVALEALDVR